MFRAVALFTSERTIKIITCSKMKTMRYTAGLADMYVRWYDARLYGRNRN